MDHLSKSQFLLKPPHREEEFIKRGETLDAEKEAELKRMVDKGYNDPEKLARDIAEAFGLKNG